jgi:peptidoglycan/LPS O-acetylase OafA/YrhL
MKRIEQLDGIRAVAILAVFMHHSLHVKLLWMGVDLFFVLSGFLITGILLESKHRSLGTYFAHFYERRARRILMPYVLLLLMVSLFFGTAWTQHWYFYILLTNFLMPLNIPQPDAFIPLWSLAVEEQFYLVWPFAIYFLSERYLRILCILLLLLAPTLRGALHFAHPWPVYMLTPFRVDLLAAGGLLSIEWRNRRSVIERRGTAAGIALIAIGLFMIVALTKFGVSTYGNTRFGNVTIYEACLLIACGSVMYALAGRGVGWLRWKPVTYIGKISYSMYLAHLGIIILVLRHFHGVVAAAVAFAITVAYAAVSWHIMEHRLLGRKALSARSQGLSGTQ